ncbi:MAG: cytochrome c biogenesis protein CcdA [Planctomycetota bacterium]
MENFIQHLNLQLGNYLETGSFIAYIIVFFAGILTSLTPCVYPLIPIVASYVGSRTEKSVIYSFFISVFYVIGIAIVYTFLGLLASLGGKRFGNVQTNPWINFGVGNLFILFGLSLLDVFSFPILGSLGSSGSGKGRGLFGALLLGMTSGFIAVPCTTAILGSLLTFVATRQSLFFGGTLLFTYAIGMGFLLVIIGTFSGFLTSLPKASGIQKFLGVLIILMGEYFLIQAGRLGIFNIFY